MISASFFKKKFSGNTKQQFYHVQNSENLLRDPLTSLFNRRYLEETLEREIKRAERKKYSIGIILADIDHFKQFTEACGRTAGDAILRIIGQSLQSYIRDGDIACRYYGDEFFLIMPEITLQTTTERTIQLLNDINRGSRYLSEQPSLQITLSFGIAMYPDHGSNSEELIAAANKALYRAKMEGQGKVAVANPCRDKIS